jgi:uncharacterized protein YjbI with pentapeptide repeats
MAIDNQNSPSDDEYKAALDLILNEHYKWTQNHREGRRLDLSSTFLYKADFSGAKLRRANFHGADMEGAYLRFAKLKRAYFTSANINGAQFSPKQKKTVSQDK